ncbi:hypothetical protein SAMN04244553_3626 [Nocardia amikacinitolerans]|uniref:Uncharacterized protein n=1 Tax=Nocardia amikacinitolerans TaxID=756689 RepID=A0A285LK12_9NOCA|nr:hypothetical protein [Nocardia amikacinitolerans]MCP2278423.1 Tetratricopeptide repeat-containing protein [Nocardia amikacinitolerans]SNY84387.1 hypothetical protein SAMN04244553_3626 [Nocardia amikacinitolerans]
MELQPALGGSRDWAAIAEGYLDSGDDVQAHMAAKEATNRQPDNAVAWHIRARASLRLDKRADALFEVNEAVRLGPHVAEFYATLGDVRCAETDWRRAREAYSRAKALDPANPFYAVGIANTYVDDLDTAISIYEDAVRENPSNLYFREGLAVAVAESITEQWSELADGGRAITSAAQLEHARRGLARLDSLDLSGPEFDEAREQVDEIRRLADRATRVQWYGSDHMGAYLLGTGVAITLFLIGIAAGNGGLGFLAVLLGAGIVVLYVRRHRMAGWQWMRRQVSESVRRTGLQDRSS